nr:hypothetical protein GCM10020093_014780 [Planobispora longispora]
MFPNLTGQPPAARNALWQLFTGRDCCNPVVNLEEELPQMVATLRAGFGRHLGEPVWTDFVRRLSAASPEFARMWDTHDVARPGSRMKIFQHSVAGLIRTVSTSMTLASPPETRMVVYTPADDESRERIAWLRANLEVPTPTTSTDRYGSGGRDVARNAGCRPASRASPGLGAFQGSTPEPGQHP